MSPKKFRCWSKTHKGWVNVAESFRNGSVGWLDNTDGVDDTLDLNLGQDEFIWLQYTGINDRNGIELYERDVVKSFFNGEFQVCEIVYKRGQFTLMNQHVRKDPDGKDVKYAVTGINLGYASDGDMAGNGRYLEFIASRFDRPDLVVDLEESDDES